MNLLTRLLIFSAIIFNSQLASAVDLANRLGVGYSNQMSADLPSFTAQYYPNSMMGMSVALGVDTEKNSSDFGLLFKLYRIVFTEKNMNFYMGGGAGLLSTEVANTTGGVDNRSGFELSAFVGGEFFFSGLESLGFTFEAGVAVRSDSQGARFRTVGDHPLRGGIIFYF